MPLGCPQGGEGSNEVQVSDMTILDVQLDLRQRQKHANNISADHL